MASIKKRGAICLNSKKDWIPNMKNKYCEKTSKWSEILGIATDYYKKLYQSRKCKHVIEEYNSINNEEIEPILKEETIKSIKSQKLDKAPGWDLIMN